LVPKKWYRIDHVISTEPLNFLKVPLKSICETSHYQFRSWFKGYLGVILNRSVFQMSPNLCRNCHQTSQFRHNFSKNSPNCKKGRQILAEKSRPDFTLTHGHVVGHRWRQRGRAWAAPARCSYESYVDVWFLSPSLVALCPNNQNRSKGIRWWSLGAREINHPKVHEILVSLILRMNNHLYENKSKHKMD
jgi:hypothetical protein